MSNTDKSAEKKIDKKAMEKSMKQKKKILDGNKIVNK
jgi:hypothetical protein